MSLKYAVIGSGAIGGYYGGKLAHSGKEVHFLFHSDYDYVKENGLTIDSVTGNFKLSSVLAYQKTSDMPTCDVVLVGLKTNNNTLLKDMLIPILSKNTLVILIQNGYGLEYDLQKEIPDLCIAGGLAFICSQKTGKGHISHFDYGNLNLGSFSCQNNQLLEEVSADFNAAGINTNILDLEIARWKKLVWNIPFNGLSVILNTSTSKMMNHHSTVQLIHKIMLEIISTANRMGCKIEEEYADEMIRFTKKMKPYSPSMKIDFDEKRPLEIEYIYSRPIKEALQKGIDMPLVSMLEKQLLFIQDQYIN